MELDDGDVLFTGGLLSLNQTSCVVNADNQTTCDLRIEGTTVTSLLDLENSLDPSDDLVRRWVARLV